MPKTVPNTISGWSDNLAAWRDARRDPDPVPAPRRQPGARRFAFLLSTTALGARAVVPWLALALVWMVGLWFIAWMYRNVQWPHPDGLWNNLHVALRTAGWLRIADLLWTASCAVVALKHIIWQRSLA